MKIIDAWMQHSARFLQDPMVGSLRRLHTASSAGTRSRPSLGHASIVTKERYLHSLPTAGETVLDAPSRIRGPHLARPA